MKKIIFVLIILLFAVSMPSLSFSQDTGNSNNELAVMLYKEIAAKDPSSSVFFSPFSIYMAFGMVYEGAGGDTAGEIQSVFNFLQNDKERGEAFKKIYNELNKKDAPYEISTANALFMQKYFSVLPAYKDILTEYYNAEAKSLDFCKASESAEMINAWVSQQTRGRINSIVQPEDLNCDISLILANAIYFKGFWEQKFDKAKTTKDDFYVTPGETIKVDMMVLENILQELYFNYMENDLIQMIELPYKGDDLSMFILLPKKSKSGMEELEKVLTTENLSDWQKNLNSAYVWVYLPKFELEVGYSLNSFLEASGIKKAFSPSAEFSKITTKSNLYISGALHKSFIKVDEEGSEAAAVTGTVIQPVSLKPSKLKPIIFRADRPFIFMIQHKKSGAILFMGKFMG